MKWRLSHRADPFAAAIADRHYSRQKVGSPQFVPPGRCLVMSAGEVPNVAYWVTSWPFAEYVKHRWAGAWICSAFRNEGAGVASDLIIDALAATQFWFGRAPDLGMVTFVDEKKVKPTMVRGKPVFGWSFRKAGFSEVGYTKGGLLALQLLPSEMPSPKPCVGMNEDLFGGAA